MENAGGRVSIFIKIFRKNGKGLGPVEEEGGGADA